MFRSRIDSRSADEATTVRGPSNGLHVACKMRRSTEYHIRCKSADETELNRAAYTHQGPARSPVVICCITRRAALGPDHLAAAELVLCDTIHAMASLKVLARRRQSAVCIFETGTPLRLAHNIRHILPREFESIAASERLSGIKQAVDIQSVQ